MTGFAKWRCLLGYNDNSSWEGENDATYDLD